MAIYKSKKELVYDHLRTEILQGAYPPGQRLVIDSLAGELGVSQIPIREALQQLQAEGLVTFAPHVGPRVAPIEPELIWEIFQLLEGLEVISCRAACRRMSDAELEELEQIVRAMDDLLDHPDRWSEENQRLHRTLCEWGRTTVVRGFMENVLAQWNRVRRYYVKDVFSKHLDLSQRDHRELVQALRERNITEAERVVRQHNQRAYADYEAYLSTSPPSHEPSTQDMAR